MVKTITGKLSPLPQQVTALEKGALVLKPGSKFCLTVPEAEKGPIKTAGEEIAAFLTAKCGDCFCTDGIPVVLELGTAPAGVKNEKEAYKLTISAEGITVTGYGDSGLFYGVKTLLQLMRWDNQGCTLPAMEILDWPDNPFRAYKEECRYGSNMMGKEDWFAMIDDLTSKKLNNLSLALYGCWVMQYDGRVAEYLYLPLKDYPQLKTPMTVKYYSPTEQRWFNYEQLPPMYRDNFFGEVCRYAKDHGMDVIPGVNSFGHNTLIPRLYPEASAKDENGNPANTGFCTAEEKTYEILFDLYDQIIDRYSTPDNPIESFDIGMDEIRNEFAVDPNDITHRHNAWCQCPVCKTKTRQEIFFEHAAKLMKHLHSRGVKTVYMYNDMVAEHKTKNNPNPADHSALLKDALAKHGLLDVACIDWWAYNDNPEKLHFSNLHPEMGFRSSIKPWNGYYHWSHVFHPTGNIYHMLQMAHASGAEAKRSYSSWDNSYHRPNQLQADWSWNWEGTGTMDEAKERYVRRYFGNSVEAATRAFDLFDDVTRQKNMQDPNNTLSSRREILWSSLVYYGYSYYHDGKDYPRNYPGETVTKFRTDAAFCADVRAMQQEAEEAAAKAELDEKGALTFTAGDTEISLAVEDLLIETVQKEGFQAESGNGVTVVLDTNLTDELIEEGFVRELISKIQTMRKDAGFEVMDTIKIYVSGNEKIEAIFGANADEIKSDVLATDIITAEGGSYTKAWDINGEKVTMGVEKN